MVVPYLASQPLQSIGTLKAELCSTFRRFLVSQKSFLCPEVPKNSERSFVCLKFQSSQIKVPSFADLDRDEAWSDEAAGADKTLLPHPFLVFLRSLNAWCNHLHSNHKWDEWDMYLAQQKPVQIGKQEEQHTLDQSVPLVLLPSCRDVEIDGGDCVFCKASDVWNHPDLYPQAYDRHFLAAQLIPIQSESASVTDEDAREILGLTRKRGTCQRGDGSPGADPDSLASVSSGSSEAKVASAAEERPGAVFPEARAKSHVGELGRRDTDASRREPAEQLPEDSEG
jgi:hypothetical protein